MTNKKHYSQFNLFVRSLLFTIVSSMFIFFYSFITLASMLFPMKYRYPVIRLFMKTYLRILTVICHIDCQIKGLENIPKDQNGIVLCKHQSTWETFLLPTLFDKFAVISKRELLWVPFFGWGLASSDPITINRKNKTSAMQQIIEKGTRCLQAGRWIFIFPEGTRTASGQVGDYKLGGPRLAAATGYPVLPIAHNAGRFWPRRKFIKRPGTITMVIGPLIETKGRKAEEVLADAKGWIEETMLKIDR